MKNCTTNNNNINNNKNICSVVINKDTTTLQLRSLSLARLDE